MIKKKIIYRKDNIPYIIRWNLFECKYLCIKIHKMLISDDDCLHDHPWAFLTFIFKGVYVEYRHKKIEKNKKTSPIDYNKDFYSYETTSKLYSRFSLLYRPANYIHRLEIHQPAMSFVITFKKTRIWGFWTNKGFIPWFKYNSNRDC